MSSMAETITNALAAVGPSTESRLRTIIEDFAGLSLSTEDRLGVLATVIASAATVHHAGHKNVYLEAVRIWSIEIAATLEVAPPRLDGTESAEAAIDEGAE